MNHPAFDAFNGNLDDIGIWNRALTDAEVMALYLGEPPVVGCTDATACNFNPEANADDGSCVPSGCLDAAACNFNAAAGCGGVACDFTCCPGPGCCGVGTVWDAEAGVCVPWVACPDLAYNPDYDADGAITVTDLLALLAIFEDVDSDGDGIFDSQDDCVGVYDACGVCNGTGVDSDTDGVCDDVDPCVGALDACGVCNGPGPNVPVIDEIIFATDSVFLPPIGSWYVFSYAVDTLYTYVCPVQGCTDGTAGNFDPAAVIDDGSCTYGPAQCGGASTVTFDGHTYNLVGIGNQCWFKENLRSDNYRNGDAIPGNLNNSQWTSTTSGAQAVYNNNDANLATYGRLYNGYAVNDARGLCPTGFHVPTDDEWTVLENFLGGSSVAGGKMKSSPSDSPAWNGTNSSGFSALPGGNRDLNNGNFDYVGDGGYWWSSSAGGAGSAWSRNLYSANDNVFRYGNNFRFGFSVRCVRDE